MGMFQAVSAGPTIVRMFFILTLVIFLIFCISSTLDAGVGRQEIRSKQPMFPAAAPGRVWLKFA
jgi:flagellar biogenesis protein FliO